MNSSSCHNQFGVRVKTPRSSYSDLELPRVLTLPPIYVLSLCLLALLPMTVLAESPQRIESKQATFVLEQVIDGLGVPWGMAFISDHELILTEREGNIKLLDTRSGKLTPLQGAPAVLAEGQGGMLDRIDALLFACPVAFLLLSLGPQTNQGFAERSDRLIERSAAAMREATAGLTEAEKRRLAGLLTKMRRHLRRRRRERCGRRGRA